MKIHKEGRGIIVGVCIFILVVAVAATIFFRQQTCWHLVLYAALLLFLGFILRFFRVPNRADVHAPDKVLSVCDGKVVVIEEVYEKEYFKDKRILVSIFMSAHNVHINWFPVSGIVKYVKYHRGKKLVAFNPKSSEKNERSTVVVRTENDREILFRQIAGKVARRIVCYPKEGVMVKQGSEMGFIKFGSRIDHYLPLDADIKVSLKEKVKGKTTVLAVLR